MRATIPFLRERFDHFNHLCFGGALPPIRIALSRSRRTLGQFRHRTVGTIRECDILISVCYDRPQTEIEDTLIHEMIHYYIWHNRIPDSSTHGTAFRRKMQEINTRFGRNLEISHRSTAEEHRTDTSRRANHICITHWQGGQIGLTVCATTCIFKIRAAFLADPRIASLEWRWSSDPLYNRYPKSRTPRAIILTPAEYRTTILPTSLPATCTPHTFHLQKPPETGC